MAGKPKSQKMPMISARVSLECRHQFRVFCAQKGVTMQVAICQAMNAWMKGHGEPEIFDETELPRGAASHRTRRSD